jgi:DNA-binding beta-propeller fold protein YncE
VENGRDQLFVSDSGKKGIHRFDIKRGKYRFIKVKGSKGFISPVGLAADKDGNVYVSDSELGKVFIIPVDKDYAEPLDLSEDFVRPTGIAIDNENGWIYIVDTGIHGIYTFQSDKTLIKKFGHRGTQDGEFNFPTYIWRNKEGNLLVTDSLNFRIQKFDRFGNYLQQFGSVGNGTGDQARPKGVAEDQLGHIYVTDSLFHTVQIFDKSGRFLLNFGDQGDSPGQFWLPSGIHITREGTIYVADSYNKRVQIFRYIGSKL